MSIVRAKFGLNSIEHNLEIVNIVTSIS